jgi:hypothetical protein
MRRGVLVLLLFACGHERAAMVGARVGIRQGAAEQPAEGASMTLKCPDATAQDLGRGDKNGEVRAQHIGAVPLACLVTVTHPGYEEHTVRLADVCTVLAPGGCQIAELEVVLVPAAGKKAR